MYRKFASIANSAKFGYSFDSDKWEYRTNPFLTQKFRMFETYGDNLIQHSHDWPVTEEYAIDYLFSFAVVLLEDAEIADNYSHMFHAEPRPDALKFAASLVFDPEKDKEWNKKRYYSMSELKVSRNPKLQYDTRYKELNEYQTGTAESIFALCCNEHMDGLERWQYADAVRTWAGNNLKKCWMEMPAVHLKWFESAKSIRGSQADQYQLARDFRDAFEACQAAVDIHKNRKRATQYVECYRNELQRRAEREIQAAAHNETAEAQSETAAA
jgi:hypothetical protein